MKVAILILAAGSSSRMGSIKQLLPYKDSFVLGKVIEEALSLNTNNVYCVLGAYNTQIKKSIQQYPIHIIHNPHYTEGLSTSIAVGIQYILPQKMDAILLLLADQPKITNLFLSEFLSLAEKNPTKIIASSYGSKIGVPTLFPSSFFSELVQLTGDKGARDFLQKNRALVVVPPQKGYLMDMDTPEDYKRLQEGL
jgi:molybdenum cofactor cytidylyltransferase